MIIERSLILIKPDGVKRGLIGEIISRFERKTLRILAMRLIQPDEALIRAHYAEHIDKPFFPTLMEYFLEGPVVALLVEGYRAIEVSRRLMGATNYVKADPGTIRGDLASHVTRNLIHGSDSSAAAEREIALWFTTDQIVG
jgi:nucleoside-diphosphate kinase